MSDQNLALQAMNDARAQAPGGSRPALVWDGSLAQGAQDWANTMAQTQTFEHSGAPFGENISLFSGDVSGGKLLASAVQWLNEKSSYHGEQIGQTGPGGDYESWGHYTQCIWPSTTNVGMAQATASNGSIYTCARFVQQGNVQGQSATNGIDPNTSGGGSSGGGPTAGDTYTVVSGDSMYLISQKFGITLQALEALNPQVTPPAYQINVGQVLQVSGGSGLRGGGTGAPGGTYTVVPGDSMFAISQKLGVTLQALEAANPQVKGPAFQINVGDVLQIPGGSGQGSTGGGTGSGAGAPGRTYTVVPGDSMFAISQKLGVTLQALEAANPQVKGPSFQINVGDILQVPGGSGQGSTTSGTGSGAGAPGRTYTVIPGDSMFAISQKLGVTLQALEAANPQVKGPSFQINVGDVLQVPTGSGTTSGGGAGSGGGTGSGAGAPGRTYTVVPGDSMFAISQKLGVTLQALEAANPQVKGPSFQINVGDVLQVPGSQGGTGSGGGGGGQGPSHSYTVVSGDSMFSIASAHGVTLQALETANPQVRPPQFELAVGQVITIP